MLVVNNSFTTQRAECGDKVVFLCYACGVKVKEWLEENGGVTGA